MRTVFSSIAPALAICLFATVASADSPPGVGASPAAARATEIAEPPPVTMTLGEGVPKSTVIFMHGLNGDPRHSTELIRELLTPETGQPAVRVVAVWMRSQDGVHTMTDQLNRARRAIDAEPGPVLLVGHSFGGKAAVNLAAEYSKEKVTGVVGLAPSVNMLQSYWKQQTGERTLPRDPNVMRAAFARLQAALARDLAAAKASGDRRAIAAAASEVAYAQTMADMVEHDEHRTETSVSRPMLVLHGTGDRAVSIHYARRFAESNKGAVDFVELPEVDHGFGHPRMPARSVVRTMMRAPLQRWLAQQAATAPQAKMSDSARRVGAPAGGMLTARTMGMRR